MSECSHGVSLCVCFSDRHAVTCYHVSKRCWPSFSLSHPLSISSISSPPVSNIYWFGCYHSSSPLLSCFHFSPTSTPLSLPSPVMSRFNLYNKVSISMTGYDVQLLRVWLPGNWVKVTESNWFCVQFWLHCCSQAITLPCYFFYPSWNQCQ